MSNINGHASQRPDVPWVVHFALQSEFVKLASALGVEIADGMAFGEAITKCRTRVRVAAIKADQYEKVLTFIDSASDALSYQKNPDALRAYTLLQRALSLLDELAGPKEESK